MSMVANGKIMGKYTKEQTLKGHGNEGQLYLPDYRGDCYLVCLYVFYLAVTTNDKGLGSLGFSILSFGAFISKVNIKAINMGMVEKEKDTMSNNHGSGEPCQKHPYWNKGYLNYCPICADENRNRGGKRENSGRKKQPDSIKMCIKITRKNADWLRAQKGKGISRQIDMAVTAWRERER